MLNEASAWRYSINYGPEGEANYANVYDQHGELVSNLKTHHAKAVVDAMNVTISSDAVADGGPVAWRTELSYGFAHTSNLNQANEWAKWGYVQPLYANPPETAQLLERVKELEKAVEDEKRKAFNTGYVIACCNVSNLHNEPSIAADALDQIGVTKSEVEAMNLSEYDTKALKEIERSRSQSPYAARRGREGGKADG